MPENAIVRRLTVVCHRDERQGVHETRQAVRSEERLGLRFERAKGQGSHGQLYVGERLTTVKRSELSKGLLRNMLRDLGIEKEDF